MPLPHTARIKMNPSEIIVSGRLYVGIYFYLSRHWLTRCYIVRVHASEFPDSNKHYRRIY